MYYCARCKTEYDAIPENDKCGVCGSRIFYKKREPVLKKIKAY
jgi:DNA-directed RNA polymerase subunit RPC12/RpoP